jgi:hypothetical protein
VVKREPKKVVKKEPALVRRADVKPTVVKREPVKKEPVMRQPDLSRF